MKAAIIYHSVSGNTEQIASLIAEGIEKTGNIETKIMSIDSVDETFIKDSCCVVFGTPTYYASFSWQMKKWFDTANCNLADKLGCCFATANFMGGGSELAMNELIIHMLVKGMLIYSGGAAHGVPFVHIGAAAVKNGDEFQKSRAISFGERIGKKMLEIF